MRRVRKRHIIPRIQGEDGPLSHFDTAGVRAVHLRLLRYILADWRPVLHRRRFDKHSEVRADYCGVDFRLGIPPQLFQRLQDRREDRDAPELARPLPRHNVEDVVPPGGSIGFHPRPVQRPALHGKAGVGMPVTYPVGHHHSALVRLHALDDAVDVVASYVSRHKAVVTVRGTDAVRLDDLHLCCVLAPWPLLERQQRKAVPVHQESHVGELLELVEVPQSVRVALRRVCP